MLNDGGINIAMQDTLHALADSTRREILNLLKQSRLSAGEICNHFSISGAAGNLRRHNGSCRAVRGRDRRRLSVRGSGRK